MPMPDELSVIRDNMTNIIGKNIRITAKRGRKKSLVRVGVIKETYPDIFIVNLSEQAQGYSPMRILSFSYTDVLTKNVEISLLK